MKYTESLYESIMMDVAKSVKRHLNEAYDSSIVQKLVSMTKNVSKENPESTYWLTITYNGYSLLKETYFINGDVDNNYGKRARVLLGEFTDDCFEGEILTGKQALELYKQSYESNSKTGAIYCKKASEPYYHDNYEIMFAIKLSATGIQRYNEIHEKKANRIRQRYKDSWKPDIEHRLKDFKFEKRFDEDKKRAAQLGITIEDYLAVLFLTNKQNYSTTKNRYTVDEQMQLNQYAWFLEEKGIKIDNRNLKDTLLKLLGLK